jgi:hypothetical protein
MIFAILALAPMLESAPAQELFEGSLLFSDGEQRAIEVALGIRPASDLGEGIADAVIGFPDSMPAWSIDRVQLSALIYVNAAEWTLWLGGTRVSPGDLPPYLSDLRVTPSYVDVSIIQRPGASPTPVRLRPNQTFLLSGQRIIEGRGDVR